LFNETFIFEDRSENVLGVMLHDGVDRLNDKSFVHSDVGLFKDFEKPIKIIVLCDEFFDLGSGSSIHKIRKSERSLIDDLFVVSLEISVDLVKVSGVVDNAGDLFRGTSGNVTNAPNSVSLDLLVLRFTQLKQGGDKVFVLENFIGIVISGGRDEISQGLQSGENMLGFFTFDVVNQIGDAGRVDNVQSVRRTDIANTPKSMINKVLIIFSILNDSDKKLKSVRDLVPERRRLLADNILKGPDGVAEKFFMTGESIH